MTATQLKFEAVYKYTDQVKSINVMYWGMKDENYLFIPYNSQKGHFNGIPNTLTENEVQTHISAN